MNLTVPTKNKTNLALGDIVVFDGEANVSYIIIKYSGDFYAHSLKGDHGAVGGHPTLESLHKSLCNHNVEIFSSSEYELMLKKK